MVNFMKEFLSFQGVGGWLDLESLLDYMWGVRLLWLAWTKNISLLYDFERGKTYSTRENDASVIFQYITLFLVSQATSKVIIRKCLINL